MRNPVAQSMPYQNSYNINNNFSLYIQQNNSSARIQMMMMRGPINTNDMPATFNILKALLPSVLLTECFNDQNLPFHQEVRNTEIGHLFEHILLEYMCQLKIARGHKSAVYAGRTRWNWKKDPRGLFHIQINCPLKDAEILPIAIKKTILLMKLILKSNSQKTRNYTLVFPETRTLNSNLSLGLKNGFKQKKRKK
jgi:hypothetical protein